MVTVTEDVTGQFQYNGETYDATYNAETGVLELSAVPNAGQPTPGKPAPGKPAPKPPEAEQQPGGHGHGPTNNREQEQPAPAEFAAMKLSIQNILKQNRAQKLQQNQIKGKLSLKSRSLVKSQSGSKNIYAKKTKTNAYGYNIILLVDNSGSMGSSGKIQLANQVAQGIHSVFRKTDGINTKVIAFTDSLTVKANWLDPQVQTMKSGGGNADAAACYVTITEQFADTPNPEYRNILLVLSDGEPCPGDLDRDDLPKLDVFEGGSNVEIAQFIAHTAAKNNVYVAGLGIMNNSNQIPNSREVDKLKDVQKAMVQILKGAIDG